MEKLRVFGGMVYTNKYISKQVDENVCNFVNEWKERMLYFCTVDEALA